MPEKEDEDAMRILLLADEPDKSLWDHLDRRKLEGIDLIISCGDLPASYLSFITCFTKAPVLYVHGNHDGSYEEKPPEGCICIEDGVYSYKGLRILGLGGSMRYKRGPFQYNDREMTRRVRRVNGQIRRAGGVDIVVAHAPMLDVGDAEDLCHRGFEALRRLVEKRQPAFFCHGHVHREYSFRFQRERQLGSTRVINAWLSHVIEIDPPEVARRRIPKKRIIE